MLWIHYSDLFIIHMYIQKYTHDHIFAGTQTQQKDTHFDLLH